MDDAAGNVVRTAILLSERATTSGTTSDSRPPIYKVIGLSLAICSGLFIGVSFVVKKVGLLQSNKKYSQEAGDGYAYLKNWTWWVGMTLMIMGEACNFVAYAFVDAVLVTPLGALSVVVTTILSAIFLKERLSFVGKLGCFNCIVGAVVIVLNAPSQSAVSRIQDMQHYVISPGFLSYAGVIIVGCLFTIFWVGPRYGKKSMLVYISVCSWIGGLSVVATQGLGAAIVTQISGVPQFNQWFLYVLLVFVICTLLTEIVFLNVSIVSYSTFFNTDIIQKALNLFNAALVTPTYYVYFTSTTILTSAVLFRGFKGTPISITTVVMGFLQICTGVVLLQLAKSSKDVPDTAVFKGDLDQVRTIAEQEEPEFEPRADTIRGGGALLRAVSQRRARREMDEAKTMLHENMEPIGENEIVEWDGLRRRRTVLGPSGEPGSLRRSKTLHPPLGMTSFPEENISDDGSDDVHPGFFPRFGRRSTRRSTRSGGGRASPSPVPMSGITVIANDKAGYDSREQSREHVYGLPASLRPQADGVNDTAYHSPREHIQWADPAQQSPTRARGLTAPKPPPHSPTSPQRRVFSFQQIFHKTESGRNSPAIEDNERKQRGPPRAGLFHRSKADTEEEQLGLVKGDSHATLPPVYDSSPVASPERPLMRSHQERQERESGLRATTTRESDEDWQVPSATGSNRDFGILSASEHSNHSISPVVVSPVGDVPDTPGHGKPLPVAPANGRNTPRRGYQRGRYVDSDDDDFGSGLASEPHREY